MKKILFTAFCLAVTTILAHVAVVFALEGDIVIHDPSTVILCDGKFYTYGTGGISLVSDDGWIWRRGPSLPRRGVAPDVIHIGDRYLLYIAANSGPTKADINLLTNKTLDPASPDYKWEEGGLVASSDGVEDSNAIDPGVFLDPTTGKLWLTYGSYFGYIRLVELDPKTGKRLNSKELVARLTPGHTKGCTTWTLKVEDGGKTYNVVIIGSPNVNPGYRLVNNTGYLRIAEDYEKTFKVLKSLPCDIFLGAHGNYFGLETKYLRLKDEGLSVFMDPAGYKEYVEDKEQEFKKELAKQRSVQQQ